MRCKLIAFGAIYNSTLAVFNSEFNDETSVSVSLIHAPKHRMLEDLFHLAVFDFKFV